SEDEENSCGSGHSIKFRKFVVSVAARVQKKFENVTWVGVKDVAIGTGERRERSGPQMMGGSKVRIISKTGGWHDERWSGAALHRKGLSGMKRSAEKQRGRDQGIDEERQADAGKIGLSG
ncbi:hypothetical protein TNIN_312041, partial [Trichonephila inaurata madagascariensis]